MPDDKKFIDYTYKIKDYLREAEVVEGKNILDIPSSVVTTTTTYGVTFTVYRNANGKVTRININGTSTGGRSELVLKGTAGTFINDIPDGQYVFSGISGGDVGTSYWMDMRYRDDGSSTNKFYSIGDGTADIDWQDKTYDVIRVLVESGYTANNIDVYPMLCTKAEWDRSHTYEPYYIPVKDRIDALDTVSVTVGTIGEDLTNNSTAICYKNGNVATLVVGFNFTSSPSANDIIVTGLPQIKGSNAIGGFAVTRGASSSPNIIQFDIVNDNDDGVIKIRNSSVTISTWFYGEVVYFCK